MLKPGDRVFIDGTNEEGLVKDVHPHEIVVSVNGEPRKYAHEDLRRDPKMDEISKYPH